MRIKDNYQFHSHSEVPSCSVKRFINHLIFSISILVEEELTTCTYPSKYEHIIEVKVLGYVVTVFEFEASTPYLDSITYTVLDLLGCGEFTDYDRLAEERYLLHRKVLK